MRETPYARMPAVGEYARLSQLDGTAPAGRVRAYLPDLESVRKLRTAFHGQHVQVGTARVGFRVSNDLLDAAGVPGGAPGRSGPGR